MATNKENLALYKLMAALFRAGKPDEVERFVNEMLEELEKERKLQHQEVLVMTNKENLILYKMMNALFEAGKSDEVQKIIKEMIAELETKSE